MGMSTSQRKRKLQELAGPLAKPRTFTTKQGEHAYRIACRECMDRGGMQWSTFNKCGPTWIEVIHVWNLHLSERHEPYPPCAEAEDRFYRYAAEDALR